MGLKRWAFDDIGLGLNTRADLYELRPGEASDAVNVLPYYGGEVIGKRAGTRLIYLTPPGVGPIQTLYEWPEKNLIILSQDNDIYYGLRDFGTSWNKIYDSANVGHHPWCFEIAKGPSGTEFLWAVNGIDPAQVWAGAALTTTAWSTLSGGGFPPAGCTWIKLWKNRMVAGGNAAFPERLYYSDIGSPMTPNPFNTIDLRSAYDDNDTIVWAELLGDNLLVFKKNSTWLVYDVNTFANRRLGYPGVPHGNLSANLNGVVYFVGRDSMWVTDGIGEPHTVDMKVNTHMAPEDILCNTAQLIADPLEQRLVFLKPTADTASLFVSSELIVYYPPNTLNNPRDEGTWWSLSFFPYVTALAFVETSVADFETIRPVMIAGTKTPNVYWLISDSDLTDSGTAIISRWQSGVIRVTQDMEKVERIRRLLLRVTKNDSNTAFGDVTVTLTAIGVSLFSATVTATDASGYVMMRPEARGREFVLKLENNNSSANSLWRFRDCEFMYRGGKEHGKR
jgi:hypothetical protein